MIRWSILAKKIRSMAQHHPENCCDTAIFHREWTHHCSYENLPLADSPLAEKGAELLRSKIFFFTWLWSQLPQNFHLNNGTVEPSLPLPGSAWNLPFRATFLCWVWCSLPSSLSCPAKCHFPHKSLDSLTPNFVGLWPTKSYSCTLVDWLIVQLLICLHLQFS